MGEMSCESSPSTKFSFRGRSKGELELGKTVAQTCQALMKGVWQPGILDKSSLAELMHTIATDLDGLLVNLWNTRNNRNMCANES